MKLFEQIRKKHEDRLLAKAELIKEQRHAEQEKLRQEHENLIKEQEKLDAERKIAEEYRKEKLKREKEKILEMIAPLDYIVELKSDNYTRRIMGKEYTYTRSDYFICDTQIIKLTPPYSQYKFKKISGDDIGEIFTSSEDDEIKFTDLQGHEYTKDNTTNLFLVSKFRYYTIKELNDCLERVNEVLEQIAVREKTNRDNDNKIKDSIFNL